MILPMRVQNDTRRRQSAKFDKFVFSGISTIGGMGIKQRFTEHPDSVGESYGQHMRVAFHFSRELAGASLQAAVHAVLPWMCCSSASARVKQLHTEMTTGARAAQGGPTSLVSDSLAQTA